MKKIYFLTSVLLASSAVIGQSNYQQYQFDGKLSNKMINATTVDSRPSDTQNQDRVELWSEDFTGTTGLVTPNGTWTATGPEAAYWSITSTGFTAAVQNGEFLYWDSYTPLQTETGGFASTPVDGSIISPVIDLTGTTNMLLEFDLKTMACCNATDNPWEYSISTDGGISYAPTVKIDLELGNNDASNDISNPYHFTKIISLNANAALNNNIKIRFTWNGLTASGAGQYSTHYYWSIDNIVISDVPTFDIKHDKLWLADTRNSFEYTNFPTNQFLGNLVVQSKITNFGASTPTNTALDVTVFNATDLTTAISGPISGGTLLNNTLASSETDTITFDTGISLAAYATGEYKVRTIVTYTETDEVLENDTLWRTFRVSDTELGHINYDLPATPTAVYSVQSIDLGSYFDINTAVSLYGVDYFLVDSDGTVNNTQLDQQLLIKIYTVNGSGSSQTFQQVAQYDYVLTSEMVGNWYTFDFPQAEKFDLEANQRYAIALATDADVYLNYNASVEDADFSGLEIADGGSTISDIYWAGVEPYMNLNFDQTLTVEDEQELNNLNVSQNVPNPFNGQTVVSYNLNEASTVSIQVMDVTGKVISTINEGTQASGSHNITIDGSTLAVGTYFYTLTAGTYQVTKRMVVSK